jgi:hypothetical protein
MLPFDQVGALLRHKLVYVVVVAVIQAVDVLQVPAPERPLTIAYPTFGERRYLDAISIQSVTEVEVLNLYLMLTSHHAINNVLVLADGGKG